MTMDGMEIIGSQSHAATSPFLLSSPPLRHHHATFNLQTVQLSFDACLTYNTSTNSSSSNNGCIGNVNLFSETSPLSSNVTSAILPAEVTISPATSLITKSTPTLTLAALPEHQPCTVSGSENNHEIEHHGENLGFKKRSDVKISASTNEISSNLKKRRLNRTNCDDNTKEDNNPTSCRNDFQNPDEKDKTEDLNTPITTSSDLPTFFGPAAFVEPPPISGNDKLFSFMNFFFFHKMFDFYLRIAV